MLEPLLAPLREDFFLRALAAVILGGVTCACLGAYVVLRRMAFVSTALTHSILPGIVGIALMQQARSWRDFGGLLFGSVVSVGPEDLLAIGLTAAVVLLSLRALHKELELASFDEEYARLLGARPGLMRAVLLALVAVGAVGCVRLVGALLTTALFVIPAATGVLLGRTLAGVMAWGAAVAVLGGIAGLYLSYHVPSVPSGAGIVLCCALPYLLARLFAPRR